jgi:hypothetical protein
MANETYTYWIGIDGEYPTNPEFVPQGTILEGDTYPYGTFFQDDDINHGYPYNPNFLPRYPVLSTSSNPYPYSAYLHYHEVNYSYPFIRSWQDLPIIAPRVKQNEYICVYDMLTEKSEFFTSNGLAILNPTSAKIHEVINGEYSLTLVHPIDELGKWRYIRESNIIKCQGVLFTIKRVEWQYTSEKSGTVTAYCEHIFYQLNDLWIYSDDQTYPKYGSATAALNGIMSKTVSLDPSGAFRYDYQWAADMSYPTGSEWIMSIPEEGATPVQLILGSGGVLDQKGGELYRENFYFSIDDRMEHAEDDAFDIRFGENMTGFKRTVDTSTIALHLSIKDRIDGNTAAVSYSETAFPFFQFPHNVPRSITVEYEKEWYENQSIPLSDRFQRLLNDLFATYKNTATPVICYEVNVKDLKNVYPELTNHYKFKVGNTGTIYDMMMGKVTLKITETEVDGITGECTRIVIGSKNSFTRGYGYPLELNTTSESTYELPLHDSRGLLLFDSRGKQIMRKGVI